ncbi:hypothetical protein Tco_1113495, partial [Tanacetum coccineum]
VEFAVKCRPVNATFDFSESVRAYIWVELRQVRSNNGWRSTLHKLGKYDTLCLNED